MDRERSLEPEREPMPDPSDADASADATSPTPDPNDEIPVPIAMFPSEIDERAQVVEALREEAKTSDADESELRA